MDGREKWLATLDGLVYRKAMSSGLVEEIDWERWQPTERANLCFIIRNNHILLIRKKRGLGAGKINGPGGRIEPGETAAAAAIRETEEEIGVTPIAPQQIGELYFDFRDGYKLHVAVFRAVDCRGTLRETDEAVPYWVALDEIPYHDMWQDDPHWLPLLIASEPFRGYFVFDGDKLLSCKVYRIGVGRSAEPQ